MKKTKYSEERFMSILWDLYRKTSNGETIMQYGEFCKEHQVTNAMFPILVRHKVLHAQKISRFGRGKLSNLYTWASISPNIHMAKRLMDEIKKSAKDANDKHREKKMQEKQLQEQGNQKYEVIDIMPAPVNPVYEMKQTPNVDSTKQIYDVSVPFDREVQNTVTLSSDAPHVPKTSSTQKSVCILWGLISIKW